MGKVKHVEITRLGIQTVSRRKRVTFEIVTKGDIEFFVILLHQLKVLMAKRSLNTLLNISEEVKLQEGEIKTPESK